MQEAEKRKGGLESAQEVQMFGVSEGQLEQEGNGMCKRLRRKRVVWSRFRKCRYFGVLDGQLAQEGN